MPRVPVPVHEFIPKGEELVEQIQYNTHRAENKISPTKQQSPALGMKRIEHKDAKKFDAYIDDVLDNYLDAFSELCWREDNDDFLERLLKLMTHVKLKDPDEMRLLREVFPLLIVTFIISHTLTIAEEGKDTTLQGMRSNAGRAAFHLKNASSRVVNRQLKFFFSQLQHNIATFVFKKLLQVIKGKGREKWPVAFIAMLGVCMVLEDQQKTIHLVMSTRTTTENFDLHDAQRHAEVACKHIDKKTQILQQIFIGRYGAEPSPLLNPDHNWENEVGFEDKSSVEFLRQVAKLFESRMGYLRQQREVSISADNLSDYSARLVGRFVIPLSRPYSG